MAYLTSFSLLLLQIICFVFMYNKNAEFLSLILLLVVHLLFLLQFVSLNQNGLYVTVLPFFFLGWNGKLPLSILFIASWILLLTTFSIFINTYCRIRGVYTSIGKEVHLGSRRNYKMKENVKISIICGTIFLWVLFGCEIIRIPPSTFQNKLFSSFYQAVQKSSNNLILLTSCLSLIISSSSIVLAQQWESTMKIITTPI